MASEEGVCDLCGLAIAGGGYQQAFEGVEKRFCCAGCLNVYAILLESGAIAGGADFRQTELYQQSLKLGLIARPESPKAPTAGGGGDQGSPLPDLRHVVHLLRLAD